MIGSANKMNLKLVLLSAFIFCITVPPISYCTQPPYRIKDEPYINKNFEDLYYKLDTHNHTGEDSIKLSNVLPLSSSTYNLGSPSDNWKNVYASSSVVVNIGTFTATSGSFYCKTSSTGVIMKTEDGSCYAIRISNNGSIFTVVVPCPN